MSDSEDSNHVAPASNAQLEQALRHAVEKTYKSNPELLTVRKLRGIVEKELCLNDGFFKSDATWNARSKEVIQSEVAAQDEQSQPPSSLPAPSPSPAKKRKQLGGEAKASTATKRHSTSNSEPRKRQKKSKSNEEILSENESALPERDVGRTESRQSATSTLLSAVDDADGKRSDRNAPTATVTKDASEEGSESEMSVLIDEDPKTKKKIRKASSEKPSSKKRKEISKVAKATQQSGDPDAEEIKRLQGWLVKCGIRKMWFKELAPYDTPKAKVRHLKEMLSEAGMSGRYSQEKANQIREERELKADIEAVQAGAKQWGKGKSEDEEDERPRRRVARGLQELDFLKDDDGDESD